MGITKLPTTYRDRSETSKRRGNVEVPRAWKSLWWRGTRRRWKRPVSRKVPAVDDELVLRQSVFIILALACDAHRGEGGQFLVENINGLGSNEHLCLDLRAPKSKLDQSADLVAKCVPLFCRAYGRHYCLVS